MWKAREMIDDGKFRKNLTTSNYHMTNQISGGGCHSLNIVRLLAGEPQDAWVVG